MWKNEDEYWEEKKNTYAVALCWKGKLHFRQVYERKNGYCFKFSTGGFTLAI